MTEKRPRLRGKKSRPTGPWPIGKVSKEFITRFCRVMVRRLVMEHVELTGDEFSDVFAEVIGGEPMPKKIGVGDVSLDRTCWSAKTVKSDAPHRAKTVRLISGRNSPSYSLGIEDPFEDVQKTGDAVLSIWNARVDEVRAQFADSRVIVLIRNLDKLEFTIFEEELTRFPAEDFTWSINQKRNFEGREKNGRRHMFTWQHHGSQFTIIRQVPGSSRKFKIDRRVDKESIKEIYRKLDEAIDFQIVWAKTD